MTPMNVIKLAYSYLSSDLPLFFFLKWPFLSNFLPSCSGAPLLQLYLSPSLLQPCLSPRLPCPLLISLACMCVCVSPRPWSLPCSPTVLQVRLLYCSQEEAELVFKAAWAAGQAGASHMWFAVGPSLSGLGMESLPRALFAVRPQGWRDEPRRRIARGVSVLTHGAVAMRKDYGTTGGPNFVTNCMTDANQTQRLRGRMR